MSAGTPYQSLISARSRRFRTIGLVLLTMVLGMSIYGGSVLMPKLRENRALLRSQTTSATAPSTASSSEKSLHKLAKAQILFAYAYWGVCGTLIIALLLVAYLDFREVSRNYLQMKITLLAESSKSISSHGQE